MYNPKMRAVEEISVPSTLTNDPVMVKITQEAPKSTGEAPAPAVQVSIQIKDGEIPIMNPATAESHPSPISAEPISSPLPRWKGNALRPPCSARKY
ncbi:hypothetical protein F5882DRAFT_422377 [Hyaloscypha sp. PMI_1271]|nr:hypothetical protein F5882DRAFT_422377 [Hyaloscypha sp. PMI_1271]